MRKLAVVIFICIFAAGFAAVRAEKEAPEKAAVENSGAEDVSGGAKPAQKWDQMTEKEREEARAAYLKMNDVSDGVKDYLDNGGKQFETLSDADKKKLRKAYAEWEKLSPQMKETMLEKYKKWMDLSPEERKKIKQAYKKYKSASPEEKAKIREEAKNKEKTESKQ